MQALTDFERHIAKTAIDTIYAEDTEAYVVISGHDYLLSVSLCDDSQWHTTDWNDDIKQQAVIISLDESMYEGNLPTPFDNINWSGIKNAINEALYDDYLYDLKESEDDYQDSLDMADTYASLEYQFA